MSRKLLLLFVLVLLLALGVQDAAGQFTVESPVVFVPVISGGGASSDDGPVIRRAPIHEPPVSDFVSSIVPPTPAPTRTRPPRPTPWPVGTPTPVLRLQAAD